MSTSETKIFDRIQKEVFRDFSSSDSENNFPKMFFHHTYLAGRLLWLTSHEMLKAQSDNIFCIEM